jgi:hypothetical protein
MISTFVDEEEDEYMGHSKMEEGGRLATSLLSRQTMLTTCEEHCRHLEPTSDQLTMIDVNTYTSKKKSTSNCRMCNNHTQVDGLNELPRVFQSSSDISSNVL